MIARRSFIKGASMAAITAAASGIHWALAGVVEDRDPRAHGFRTPAQETANFELVHDGDEAMPVIDRMSDPAMSLGDIAEVNAAMVIHYGVIIAPIGMLADKFERLARSHVLVGIAAAIDPRGRFAPEPGYPTWIRSHAAFREQGQRLRPPVPFPHLLGRRGRRPNKERVGYGQHDKRPRHESANETVEVPEYHRPPLEGGDECRC